VSLTRPAWRSKCCPSKKVRHGSRAEAEIALARMVATGAAMAGELEVYRCRERHCKKFHLGHPVGWGRKKRKARAKE
jgi:hypothetical protein